MNSVVRTRVHFGREYRYPPLDPEPENAGTGVVYRLNPSDSMSIWTLDRRIAWCRSGYVSIRGVPVPDPGILALVLYGVGV